MARAAMDALQLEGCHVALMGGIMLNYPMIASKTAGLIRSYDKAAACFLCDRSPAVAAAEYALAPDPRALHCRETQNRTRSALYQLRLPAS